MFYVSYDNFLPDLSINDNRKDKHGLQHSLSLTLIYVIYMHLPYQVHTDSWISMLPCVLRSLVTGVERGKYWGLSLTKIFSNIYVFYSLELLHYITTEVSKLVHPFFNKMFHNVRLLEAVSKYLGSYQVVCDSIFQYLTIIFGQLLLSPYSYFTVFYHFMFKFLIANCEEIC